MCIYLNDEKTDMILVYRQCLKCIFSVANVLWVAFSIPSGLLSLVRYPVYLPIATLLDKTLLMLTDAARYMVKVGTHLKVFYSNLIRYTCVALVMEKIPNQFQLVNDIINKIKFVFVKAPLNTNRCSTASQTRNYAMV
jgi:hypothetical protein